MSSEIAMLIKHLAVDAVEAKKPADVIFGTVVSVSPLKIQTDQKIVLEESCLILCKTVTKHCVDVSVSAKTNEHTGYSLVHSHKYNGETALSNNILIEPHSHSYSGDTQSWGFDIPAHQHIIDGVKKVIVQNGLQQGETVVMLRVGGGQRFVVLDRVQDLTAKGEWIGDT